jgi:hypothetical protein
MNPSSACGFPSTEFKTTSGARGITVIQSSRQWFVGAALVRVCHERGETKDLRLGKTVKEKKKYQ